jgi:hypothetical protein
LNFPGEKLVIRLWETLAEKGIGSLLSPWQTIREGRARNEVRRQELLMLAQAEMDAADLRAGRKRLLSDGSLMPASPVESAATDVGGRIEPTLFLTNAVSSGAVAAQANSARSEINASKAIIFAEEQLANDQQSPPDRSVDDDWLFVWREHAGKVSAEDLQRLWGSVLAGEIKSPGKYSIRTLEFLKTLSKSEAETISMLATYVIDSRIAREQKDYLQSNGVTFNLLLGMQELGIISGVEAVGLNTTYKSVVSDKFVRALVSHGKALIVEHEDKEKSFSLEVYLLTEVGRQILGLGSFEPDVQYMRRVGQEILKQGFRVRIADWMDVSENEGQYSNAEVIDGTETSN